MILAHTQRNKTNGRAPWTNQTTATHHPTNLFNLFLSAAGRRFSLAIFLLSIFFRNVCCTYSILLGGGSTAAVSRSIGSLAQLEDVDIERQACLRHDQVEVQRPVR